MNLKYLDISYADAGQYFNGEAILLVTATKIETDETHQKMKPFPGKDAIIKVHKDAKTYYFGVIGNYKVVHIQCSMGSISRDSSIVVVKDAIQLLSSKVVIMVGIAFGIENKNQKIGDVLVAEAIQPYDSKRIGEAGNIQRSYSLPSSKILLDRFKSLMTWQHILDGDVKANLIFSLVLSGEELIDNIEHRNKLVGIYKTAKGGEMEGAGVYSACDGIADCILVKGICDFADGHKGLNKDENQKIAVRSALSACSEVFSSLNAFKDLGIQPISENVAANFGNQVAINEVLFEIYEANKEKYYVKRDEDDTFMQIIPKTSFWIYGPPGCGKSNLIIRNLLTSNSNFIQITLASCVGMSVDDYFKEVLIDLHAKTAGPAENLDPKSFNECSKLLMGIWEKHYKGQSLIIFIEEIPLSSAEQHREFSEKLFSLLIAKSYSAGLENVKFILSCIDNPTQHIQIFQQKIHQHLQFLELKYWGKEGIEFLVQVIEGALAFKMPEEEKSKMIEAAKGSPRFIKKVYRSLYMLNKSDQASIRNVIAETQRELRNG